MADSRAISQADQELFEATQWAHMHTASMALAWAAEAAARAGEAAQASALWLTAAHLEHEAMKVLSKVNTPRTLGITAVSCASLYAKAGADADAASVAEQCLAIPELPSFARTALLVVAGQCSHGDGAQ